MFNEDSHSIRRCARAYLSISYTLRAILSGNRRRTMLQWDFIIKKSSSNRPVRLSGAEKRKSIVRIFVIKFKHVLKSNIMQLHVVFKKKNFRPTLHFSRTAIGGSPMLISRKALAHTLEIDFLSWDEHNFMSLVSSSEMVPPLRSEHRGASFTYLKKNFLPTVHFLRTGDRRRTSRQAVAVASVKISATLNNRS